MTAVGPFFYYLGSKHSLTRKLPPPKYDLVIEPFAGSAGYACNYPDRDVLLIENSPAIASMWRWLIAADPSEILALPLMQYREVIGKTKETENLPVEAKMLLSLFSVPAPRGCSKVSSFNGWKDARRAKMARDITKIRHWRVQQGDYSAAPNVEATWVIDPPYQNVKCDYLGGTNASISFTALGKWCRSRKGQVFVHEGKGANWLPFKHFAEIKTTSRHHSHVIDKRVTELLWTNADGD